MSPFDTIAYVIAAVSLVGAILVYRRQRRYKQLSYEFINQAPLVLSGAITSDEVRVHYRDQVLYDPRVALIRFINSGNAPITSSDFDRGTPIKIDFQPANVISATQVRASHDDIRADLYEDRDSVNISPLLLNPGDWFAVSVLVDGEPSEPRISARLVGTSISAPISLNSKPVINIVPALDLLRERSRAAAPIVAVGLLTIITVSFGLLAQLPTQLTRRQALLTIISSTVAGGLASWQTAIAMEKKKRKKGP